MPPIPLEGAQMPSATPQEASRGSISGSISLGMLIDLIVQRTYHELTVLAELLPRKTDMERKIEIYNYSARTRQLFVRLLALVKWANSASKVDKSAQIMAFLEKQSLLFVDTADMLARMARDTLVHARLPSFHIPAAVEVLTTGTFGRLPSCIRDRIVPPDPITPTERRSTLDRLNQVIQQRLVSGNLVPQMRNLKIDSGRVTFTVTNEFEVSLTVMGDGPNIPWRLLDIDILVDDKETGDGKALVHSLQVNYIHQLVQTRLVDNQQPLAEVYHILHAFCQSLQLEVLYTQTLRLCRDRLDDLVHVDEYTPGKCLTIAYWKELAARDPRSELGYKLTVQVDTVDPARPLSVIHMPQLPVKESDIADRAIRSEYLSMERLLVHTIYMRTKRRLAELQLELQEALGGVALELEGTPAILYVPIAQPCLRAEQLLVTVDTHTGMLQCSVPQYDPPIMHEIASALNQDRSRVPSLLTDLRFWLIQRRCEKTLQHLPATAYERLPLLHLPDHPMTKISRNRMYIRLHRHPNSILIVEMKEKSDELDIELHFYMACVKQSSIEDDPEDDSIETEIPKMYLKVMTLIEFDSFVLLHGPFTSIEDEKCEPGAKLGMKRKLASVCSDNAKKSKQPAYFVPELAHVVALCDERIPFVHFAQELNRRQIPHQGLQVETGATGLVLKIVQLPSLAGPNSRVSPTAMQSLMRRVLSVSIRVHGKGTGRSWICELIVYGSPLPSLATKEQGLRRPVYLTYDMAPSDQPARTVDCLLADWAQIVHLYDLIQKLADDMQTANRSNNLHNQIVIRSYTYTRLNLGYGPEKGATCTVTWSEEQKAFSLQFGAVGTQNRAIPNAHSFLREQLEAHLNRHRNLALLMDLLNESYQPMVSLSKLPMTPQLGVHNNRSQVPVQSFTVIPQSHTLLKLVYQGMYCLELRLKGGGIVSIRDGAYSRFDRSYVIDELTPTQGLKGFLGKYVEETATATALRRRSQCEDDDPPSPMTLDESGGGGGAGSGGLGGGGFHSPASGLKFHAPVTPPSGSNPHTPHTPSSPHTQATTAGSSQQSFQTASPATSFSLASPPSLPPPPATAAVNPSPAGMLSSHASPGGAAGLVASSPGGNPLHVPSPAGLLPSPSPGPNAAQVGHSPGSFLGTSSNPLDGSPFSSATSPAVAGWPGSPSMPRPSPRPGGPASSGHPNQSPSQSAAAAAAAAAAAHVSSRMLPPRSWAGAVPTQLTNEAFDCLCTAAPHPLGVPGPEMAPLDRFLGCVYMRRQLQRIIQSDECLTGLTSTEPLVVLFKVDTLQCRVALEPQHMQSLQLKVSPLPEHKEQWSQEEIQLLEKFFDTRAAIPPYKPNALVAFCRMLNVPFNVLKDFLQIIKLELVPGLIQQHQFKWSVQWCFRVPPSASPLVPIGQPAVIICRSKILFYVQITRVGGQYAEPPSLVLPLVYDVTTNLTQMAEKRDPGPSPALTAVSMQLKRFAEFGLAHSTGECSLFPALRDLLANLLLPSEPVQMISSPAHTGSVTPTMQPSPAMMHSPMSGAMNPQVQGMGPGGPGPVQGPTGGPYPGMGMGQHMMGPN